MCSFATKNNIRVLLTCKNWLAWYSGEMDGLDLALTDQVDGVIFCSIGDLRNWESKFGALASS